MGITHPRSRFLSPALILSCLALFAALGGSTYAATSSSSSRISSVHFTSATLKNGWQSGHKTNPLDAPPGYAKDSVGVVHLRGDLFGGSNDSVAFVLPKRLRTSHVVYVPIYTASGATGDVLIQPNGRVVLLNGNAAAFASVDGVSFAAGE